MVESSPRRGNEVKIEEQVARRDSEIRQMNADIFFQLGRR